MIPVPNAQRKTFLEKGTPIRLGGLASDLARITSFIQVPALAATETMLEESRAFIEWSAPDLLPDRVDDAARLVEIQRGLTFWYHKWQQVQADPSQRAKLAEQAQQWSDEILKMSGLLDQE
ncbi:MAG: hypothetical protein HY327_08305 [Chloroflexi bacterium]|nr:hypothetical protein [Chloroflexota bacterium]